MVVKTIEAAGGYATVFHAAFANRQVLELQASMDATVLAIVELPASSDLTRTFVSSTSVTG